MQAPPSTAPFAGIQLDRSPLDSSAPLVMTREEMEARGWDEVDVVFVSGDAYVDHPSFAMALLGRLLEAAGYRVAILSQPDWRSCDAWKPFGAPRLFFAISAGHMDSMINHYTARHVNSMANGFAKSMQDCRNQNLGDALHNKKV